MLRFGLFGTGHWAAETHAAALDAHPKATLAGVWGRNPDNAAALGSRYGVPTFDDVDALIDACLAGLPPPIPCAGGGEYPACAGGCADGLTCRPYEVFANGASIETGCGCVNVATGPECGGPVSPCWRVAAGG